jgi:superfamily I DNA and/or RNA helicase
MAATNEERKRYVKEYIRSLKAIEDCIEPYKEQKRELRSEFRENGWLNSSVRTDGSILTKSEPP